MAKDDSTDVLMTFLNGSEGVAAECASVWNISDSMKTDFSAGTFFEIDDFSIGGGLESDDAGEKTSNGSGSGKGENTLHGTNKKDDKDKKTGSRGSKFSNYILSKSWFYRIEMQEISISRQLDKASPVFMQNCLYLKPFTKAVIVKRKVIGGVASQGVSVNLMGYLRLEFVAPLITSVEWEDGDIVKEKLKFVCRGFTAIYKPQKPDGSLAEPISTTWKPDPALTGSSK